MEILNDYNCNENEGENDSFEHENLVDGNENEDAELDSINLSKLKWQEDSNILFNEIPVKFFPKINLPTNLETPMDYFNLFFDKIFLDFIVKESNRYYSQILENKQKSAYSYLDKLYFENPVDNVDIKKYIFCIIYMGVYKLPSVDEHWKTNNLIKSAIPQILSRNRFYIIGKSLHFTNNKENIGKHAFHKIENVINYLNDKFSLYYYPSSNLTIDEVIVGFKGRLGFKFYIPLKPTKWGMKIHIIADAKNGYCLRVQPDPGKTIQKPNNYTEKLVIDLSQNYHFKYHNLYIDSWYNSISLSLKMLKLNTFVTGMIKKKRKYIPETKDLELSKNDFKVFSNENIVFISYKDNKQINITSTTYNNLNSNSKLKPEAFLKYSENFRGVDLLNQNTNYYKCNIRSIKWYKTLWYHLLEISIFNSLILYNLDKNSKLTLLEFHKILLDNFIASFERKIEMNLKIGTKLIESQRIAIEKFKKHNIISKEQRKCKNCNSRPRTGCDICKINLCKECFNNYHISNNLF